MARLSSLLFGLGVGAGLMYFWDPNNGSRRRANVRDQVSKYQKQADDAIETGVNDLRNRTQGALSEVIGYVSTEPAADWVLQQRVRSKLGTLTRHVSSINVDVREKKAYLSGDVLAEEVDRIVNGVRMVRGIDGVENQLTVHQDIGEIPTLRDAVRMGVPATGVAQAVGRKNWSPSTRLVAGAGGGALWLMGAARGGIFGRMMSLAGIGLAIRSATNLQLQSLIGMTEERRIIRVHKTIQVAAPIEKVYDFWSHYTNFPSFMSHLSEVTDLGGGRSHWVAKGPAGVPVEWDAITTANVPNEVIAWESVPGATLKSVGEVRFRREGENATQVNVRMYYNPPAGAVGHTVASIFGVDPKSAMDDDLMKMQNILSNGGSEAQSGRRPARGEGRAEEPRRRNPSSSGGESSSG